MKLNILYSTDENYARHCGASIYSLFSNNLEIDEIQVFIVENQLSSNTKEILLNLAEKFNRQINFINIQKLCKGFKNNNDFPKSAFGRLFAEDIDNNIDKILYLDCDTIINNSLEELWSININDYYVAAIQDSIQSFNVELIDLPKDYRYVNSGVLLINLKKWREKGLKEKFISCMEKYKGKVPHHDQGVINIVCQENILYLSPKYNYMPEMINMTAKQLKRIYKMKQFYTESELDEARKNPYIIHYITKWYNRPWFKSCTHPLKDKYIENLNKTGFDTNLLEGKLKRRILFQKKFFEIMPFTLFIMLQRAFDIRRRIIVALNIEKEK